jgi:hypothetical protein
MKYPEGVDRHVVRRRKRGRIEIAACEMEYDTGLGNPHRAIHRIGVGDIPLNPFHAIHDGV